jgi:hypothetical protein
MLFTWEVQVGDPVGDPLWIFKVGRCDLPSLSKKKKVIIIKNKKRKKKE